MLPLLGRSWSLAAATLLAGSLVCCCNALPRTPSPPAGEIPVLRGGVPAVVNLYDGGSGLEMGAKVPGSSPGCLGRTAGATTAAAPQDVCGLEMGGGAKILGIPPGCLGGTTGKTTAVPRYRKQGWSGRKYELSQRPDEDLSVESLRAAWNFQPSDCLTFRHRKPDTWGEVQHLPGILGVLELLMCIVPPFHILLYLLRGRWNCAVCDLPRSSHPLQTLGEAERAFREAMRDRDIPLAVRLVKGGVACEPESDNHELVLFIVANYCKDSFEEVRDYEDPEVLYEHLTTPSSPTYSNGWGGFVRPFL